MIALRSFAFAIAFYGWSAIMGLAMTPLLLAPRRFMSGAMVYWARGAIVLLRIVCDIRVEFRGVSNLPAGPVLIAAKHQCMFDTMGPLVVLNEACYVMKRELSWIPFYSWFSAKTGMIVIDRAGQAAALRGLLSKAKERIREGRQGRDLPRGVPHRARRDRRIPVGRGGALPPARPLVRAARHELGQALAGARISPTARNHRLRVPPPDHAGAIASLLHGRAGNACGVGFKSSPLGVGPFRPG